MLILIPASQYQLEQYWLFLCISCKWKLLHGEMMLASSTLIVSSKRKLILKVSPSAPFIFLSACSFVHYLNMFSSFTCFTAEILAAAHKGSNGINLFTDECDKTESFLPFGSGSRACVGQKFAVLGIAMLIASLLRSYEVRCDNFFCILAWPCEETRPRTLLFITLKKLLFISIHYELSEFL
jgi:hypothetical protein